jgi:hypothetical protein
MDALDPELRVFMRIEPWDDLAAVFGVTADAKLHPAIMRSPTFSRHVCRAGPGRRGSDVVIPSSIGPSGIVA